MKICFFARVERQEVIDRVQFYALDVRILRDLGHEVVIATRFKEIPVGCDLYYIFWWSWAFQPLVRAYFGLKPSMITGTFDYGTCGVRRTGQSYLDRPWWQRLIIRYGLMSANANVFVCRSEFEQIPLKLRVRNPRYIPLVVDTLLYRPSPVAKEPFIFNVAWSDSLNAERKCLRQIVEAFSIVRHKRPDVRLVMGGKQGEYHPVLVETAQKLGVNDGIDFIGTISEGEKIELMRRCSVYLQPTLFEGFGLAIAEAMACGAAVVSSPVGAVPEVVGDGGVLVNGEDSKAIADAVNDILDRPELRDNLGRRARAHIVRNFAYERRKCEMERLISELVRN